MATKLWSDDPANNPFLQAYDPSCRGEPADWEREAKQKGHQTKHWAISSMSYTPTSDMLWAWLQSRGISGRFFEEGKCTMNEDWHCYCMSPQGQGCLPGHTLYEHGTQFYSVASIMKHGFLASSKGRDAKCGTVQKTVSYTHLTLPTNREV